MERKIVINENGDTISIVVDKLDDMHVIAIDGVFWCATPNQMHATVLFNMMADHITEYMNYEKKQ